MFEAFFQPRSVAVIGASRTPGKVGHDVVKNLLEAGFEGHVYPVNPKAEDVLGLTCYASVCDVPGEVDLAVIAIPAGLVLGAVDECAAKGIRAVVVISSGFKESGPEGAALEKQLAAKCREHGVRCIGPNCLGLISPHEKMNASFGPVMPGPGKIAFFSQSGALGTAVLDVAAGEGIGLSRFVSFGNKADVDETDLLEALGEDARTAVILGYLESIKDGPRFMQVASRVTRAKPVILFKSGRTRAGARAASSHTGSLAGSDSTYDAAFGQCGVVRAESVGQFFEYARAFADRKPPRGGRVAIVTNAGGPGIIATDAIEVSALAMAELSDETKRRLAEGLPPQASVRNPVDVLGDARAERYRDALETVCADPGVDAALVILTPQASTESELTAEVVADAGDRTEKPILASFMGRFSVGKAWAIMERRNVPNFHYPDRAVIALEAMYRYRRWLNREDEAPPAYEFDRAAIARTLSAAAGRRARALGEREARAIAEACHIPLPRSVFAAGEDDAARAAAEIGYPVVLKISSDDILHKSDAGGVRVGLGDETAVRAACREVMAAARRYAPEARLDGVLVQQMAPPGREAIVGVSRDPQFGPVVMFGLGGVYVEVLKDVVFRVAPITRRDAREMIEGIRGARVLHAFRGQPEGDLEALADCLTRVSQLAVERPEIAECDLNPLTVFAAGQGVMALDVRFGLAAC